MRSLTPVLCAAWLAPATGKGCFPPTAEVTMADGQIKLLGDVTVGDSVLSWDESSGRAAVATVRDVPRVSRAASEMVTLRVRGASFQATQDHPFWSHSRSSLVSVEPNATKASYGCSHVGLLREGEELEGVNGASVPLLALERHGGSVDVRSLRSTFGAEPVGVEVMTLSLEPHHWFYVHGVRVHNKGGSSSASSASGGMDESELGVVVGIICAFAAIVRGVS